MGYINNQNFILTVINEALMSKVLLRRKLTNEVIHSDTSTAVVFVAYKVLQELTAFLASYFFSSIYKLM